MAQQIRLLCWTNGTDVYHLLSIDVRLDLCLKVFIILNDSSNYERQACLACYLNRLVSALISVNAPQEQQIFIRLWAELIRCDRYPVIDGGNVV